MAKPYMKKGSVRTVPALAGGENSRQIQQPLPGWDRRIWLVAIPLALIVIAAFIPALDNSFVNWDDDKNFLENPFYRGLGVAQMKWAWSTFWVGAYQPLTWLLFEAQYVWWKLDPHGYHLTSVILHAANAVVLYVLTVTLLVRCETDLCLKNPWTCSLGAGLATALFAVHPLRVEAVAWATCQSYLWCALFSMLAVLAYLRAFEMGSYPQWGWLVATFMLFVAALLSHAVAMSLPAVLMILDEYPLRRFGDGPGHWFGSSARRAWREKVPFIIVSLVFVGLAVAAKPQTWGSIERYDASQRFAHACYGIWFYILKTVLPLDLIAFNPLPRKIDWLAPPFLFCILGTMAIFIGLFLLRRRSPGLVAAWLSYLVILAPNSGIIRINNQITADRYSYMAMLGWVGVAAACFCWLCQTSSRGRLAAIGIVALCFGALLGLVPMTWSQCRTWRDSRTLWTYALTHGAGSNSVAHYQLGLALYGSGNFEAATAHYAEALRLDPTDIAHNNLGVILSRQGNYEAAAAHYAEALRLNPDYLDSHYNLGMIRSRQERFEEAAAQYAETLRLNPGFASAHNNLGIDFFRQGKLAEAAAHYTEALRLNPYRVDSHTNLGIILSRQGKFEEAETHYAEALRLNPGYHEARNNLEADRAPKEARGARGSLAVARSFCRYHARERKP